MTFKQQLVEAVMERVYNLLNEGRNAEKAKEKTLEVIRNFFGNKDEDNNEFVDAEAIENKLKELCFHANIPDSVIRLEPIIMNVALSLGFEQQNPDSAKLNRLFRIVNYITKCVREKIPLPKPLKQLNELTLENTTYDRLNELFGTVLDKQDAEEAERINNADYSEGINPNYKILSDIDFDTANDYGNYSCSDSKLCYTQSESTWNQYTNGGSNTVYLLLRKDWKNIPEEHGKNTPYDDYGLSMIFVFVDEDGNIAYSNTRWNHRTNGKGPQNVDQSFTKEQLSQLLNAKFESIFKPLHTFAEGVANIKQQLQNGANPEDVFDWVYDFQDGFAHVQFGDKYNFIDRNGNILSDLWFDTVENFRNGFARVELNGKYNYIKTDGNILYDDLWFDDIYPFYNGFAKVYLNGKYNLITTDGKILSEDLWFDMVEDMVKDFHDVFARVKLNDKYNLINTKGEILREDLWFDWVNNFRKGFAEVQLNGKANFIDRNGNILSDNLWFDWVDYFQEVFALVQLGDKYNFIDRNGNVLREDLWFDEAGTFHNGFAKVRLGDGRYFLDSDGELYTFDEMVAIAKQQLQNGANPEDVFDRVSDFHEGIAKVRLKGEYNYITTDGEILSDLWFDEVGDFRNGLARVQLGRKLNFIDTDGNFLREDLWFDQVWDFYDGFASVILNGKEYKIDTKGNLYDLDKNPINKVTENRQRVVRITESQLRNTIKKVVTQYLNENRRR